MSYAKLKERNKNAWWQVEVLKKTTTAEGRQRTPSRNVAVKCEDADEAIRNALAYCGRWEYFGGMSSSVSGGKDSGEVWAESVRRVWMEDFISEDNSIGSAPYWWVKARKKAIDETGMNVTVSATYLAKAATVRAAMDTAEEWLREREDSPEITAVSLSCVDLVIE